MNYSYIYEIITKYYPIGIEKSDSLYDKYSGTEELKKLINNCFNESKNQDYWITFIDSAKLIFPDILVKDECTPVDTCRSLSLLVYKKQIDNITHMQKLYCHVSLLGNYFCIYGKDTINIVNESSTMLFEPIITISPMGIYYDSFIKLRLMVEETFFNYNFLKYLFLQHRVNGLKIFPSLLKGNQASSVFQALFTPENLTDYKRIGDTLYN